MKKTPVLLLVFAAIAVLGTNALSVQDDPDAAAAARAAAREASDARAREQQAQKEQKASQDWLDRQRQQSESNIAIRERTMKEAREKENEVKFAAMQKSAKELLDLSVKTYNRLNASGAQSVSVILMADLDKMEMLVKDIRKAAK
jgi:hypothetical protein